MRQLQRILEQYLKWCVSRSFLRERPLVIGVGGSVGKTSTKQAIGTALGATRSGTGVVMSLKNYNNEIGVPMTVFGVSELGRSPSRWIELLFKGTMTGIGLRPLRARTFVLELATDHPGDMAYLVDMVHPTVGVLTAISPEHTEYLGSLEGVLKEEMTLLQGLKPDQIAIVNADDALLMKAVKECPVVTLSFGFAEDATIRIESITPFIDESIPELSGLHVALRTFNNAVTVTIHGTVGRSQAYAVASAMAVVQALDIDEVQSVKNLELYAGNLGRMRLIQGIKRTWILDDTYNSSPRAVESALQDLRTFPIPEGARRIAVMGDMLELGSLSDEEHRKEGLLIAELADELIVCGTNAGIVESAALEAGMSRDRVFVFSTSEEAGRFLQDRMHEGDVILIKGSQGNRMEKAVKEVMARPDLAEELLVRQTGVWKGR